MNSDALVTLIHSAIENKYDAVDAEETVRALVRKALQGPEGGAVGQTAGILVPTHDLESDAVNQLRCYLLIERVLRFEKPSLVLVKRIHGAVCGVARDEIRFRDVEYVEDYGGYVPTPVDEIPRKLQEFEALLERADDYAVSTIPEQATFLAEIFATMIRVHPFQDGNGRTARMLVEYCLRRWGREFVVLPKVRNDVVWKDALSLAVSGEYGQLAGMLADRIAEQC
jgi:prophage maintenance system killer protein